MGKGYPFTGEKFSSCLAMYTYKDFDDAIDMVNRIADYSGPGHSCGIHTADREKAIELGTAVKVARVMVSQPQRLANSGSWTNGMPCRSPWDVELGAGP
ncbi:MAG: hypothetical protein B6D68_02275 [spirochete symbiont of Stewartia floridana]|nr:MAG: hypothetical protein B6D68_02275 [spirochete symbiont of Stewartia floridana]